MGWSEGFECLGIENRQDVSVDFCDDVFDPVDLVRRMGGRYGESRHIGRQGYGHVVLSGWIGGYPDRASEESGELLEVGLARVVCIEREGQPGATLRDGLLGLRTRFSAHVPYLTVRLYVEFVVETQTVKPVDGFPFVPLFCGDAEGTGTGTIKCSGEPWWNITVNIELYGVWLLGRVVEAVRGRRLEFVRHRVVSG